MIILNDNAVFSDVDDTLLMHFLPNHPKVMTVVDEWGTPHKVVPHEAHVKYLRELHGRGFSIVVWSMRGSKWAKIATEALGLSDIVAVCTTKPTIFLDDLSPNEFMDPGKRHYIRLEDDK